MLKTYKYQLKPTKHQETLMKQTLDTCRWIYNETLAFRKNAWENDSISLSLYDTNKLLKYWKKEKLELKQVYSQVLDNVQARIDLAFQAFFRRVKQGQNPGYPRFKGKDRYDSFTYRQSGFKLNKDILYLSKIGNVKVNLHRPIIGKIKTCTIKYQHYKWYVCFSIEYSPIILQESKLSVGIDVGLTSFATLSTNEKIDNPRFYKQDEKELVNAQRKLSSQTKGSSQRNKAKRKVNHIHKRITNKRHNFIHQESRKIVNKFGIICVEKLNTKNMIENGNLAKQISDAAWNQFILALSYKAECADRKLVRVNPAYTSQVCSKCGVLVVKELSERIHNCSSCGLIIDRDLNASYNILSLGLKTLGLALKSSQLLLRK